jgi:hypothetical protein
VATGLVNWIFDTYADSVNGIVATTDAVLALDFFTLIFPPAYLVVDYIADMIAEVKAVGASSINAAMTLAVREATQEYLYCLLPTDGKITEAIWLDFQANAKDKVQSEAAKIPYDLFLSTLSWEGIADRAGRESHGRGNCVDFDCGEPPAGCDATDNLFTGNIGNFLELNPYPGQSATLLVDGSLSTNWIGNFFNPPWEVGYRLATPMIANSITFWSHPDGANLSARTIVCYVSTDGNNWTELTTFNITWQNQQATEAQSFAYNFGTVTWIKFRLSNSLYEYTAGLTEIALCP